MGEFDRVAFVWGETVSGSEPVRAVSAATVALWPTVLECDSLRWSNMPPDLSRYDMFMVNVFQTIDCTHVGQIRNIRPDAKIIAMPDPPLETVLLRPEWSSIVFGQVALADMIGGRTKHDINVYGSLLNKPGVWLPSPIGPLPYYAPMRELTKEDYIIAADHPLTPDISALTVAVLALIQRETGLPVIYAAAADITKEYARLAGLKAEFYGSIPYGVFAEMIARARLSVDMYARHAMNRHALTCGMVGTPCVGSCWTNKTGHPKVDPFDPDAAAAEAMWLLSIPDAYEDVRNQGMAEVEQTYGFEASRARVRSLMEGIL